MAEIFELCPKLLRGMALFATEDEGRPELAGLHLRWDGKFLEIVGTDGHILGAWGKVVEDTLDRAPGEAIVPIHAFLGLLRVASKKKNYEVNPTVEVTIAPPRVSVKATLCSGFEWTIDGSLPDGQYPAWRNIIPSEDQFQAVPKLGVNVSLLQRFQKAAPLLGILSGGIVRLRFTQETGVVEVKLGSANPEFTGYVAPATVLV